MKVEREAKQGVSVTSKKWADDKMFTLLISCPAHPGIVASVSGFIFERKGNIFQSDQHSTDLHDGTFFMRISFTEDNFTLCLPDLVREFAPIAETFKMQWS